MFKALVLSKQDDRVTAAVEEVDEARLPEGDVTVAVEHSTLNYKDGLIILNKAPLVRSFPHVPGIDLAGRVVESAHPDWRPGDAVVLTGWGVGERQWGGHAERARVKGDWLVPLPAGWTTRARDGGRHRRLHGDARGDRARGPRARARRRRGSGHRGRGRRRLGRGRGPRPARPPGHRLDRPRGEPRVPALARRERDHRPGGARRNRARGRSNPSASPAASTASAARRSPACSAR